MCERKSKFMEQGLLGVALMGQGSAWAGESEGRRLGRPGKEEEEGIWQRDLAGHWEAFKG